MKIGLSRIAPDLRRQTCVTGPTGRPGPLRQGVGVRSLPKLRFQRCTALTTWPQQSLGIALHGKTIRAAKVDMGVARRADRAAPRSFVRDVAAIPVHDCSGASRRQAHESLHGRGGRKLASDARARSDYCGGLAPAAARCSSSCIFCRPAAVVRSQAAIPSVSSTKVVWEAT
jgi:hypothetical protein